MSGGSGSNSGAGGRGVAGGASGSGGSGGVGGGGQPRPKMNLDVLPAGQTPTVLGDQLGRQLPPPAGVVPTQYPQQFPVLPAGQFANPQFYGQPGAAYPQVGCQQPVQQPIQQSLPPAGYHSPHPPIHPPAEESTLKPGVKLFGQSFGLSFGLTMGVVTVFILIPMLLCGGCTALMLGMGAIGGVAERAAESSRESDEIRREWERQQREIDEAARVGEGQ